MLRATTSCRLYKAVNKPVKLKTSLAYEEQMDDPIERSLGTRGHTEGLPKAHSVSGVSETLTIQGPKRPPINKIISTRSPIFLSLPPLGHRKQHTLVKLSRNQSNQLPRQIRMKAQQNHQPKLMQE